MIHQAFAIPTWDPRGVVPPIRPGVGGHDSDRSPYRANLLDVVRQFGGTLERRKILRGLLDYRAALHDLDLRRGFQWLDGSFFEDVEQTRGRPPNDIDIVTFARLGNDDEQQARYEKAPHLFSHDEVKHRFLVDHYFVGLGEAMERGAVRQVAYWYSMWSHCRESLTWKGFVEIDLDSHDDAKARAEMDSIEAQGGGA